MTRDSDSIGALIRVQEAFLDNPALTVTPSQAALRFRLDRTASEAILGALLDSGVLARTPEGAYVRYFPRFAAGAASDVRTGRGSTEHAA